jgi:hypothetical protein
MTDEYAPSDEIMKVGEEGIRGEIASPDAMIDAALQLLAA